MAETKKNPESVALKSYVVESIEDSRKIKREFQFSGKCNHAEEYTTKDGVSGIAFEVTGMPYRLRLLKGSIKGGSKAPHFIGCTLNFTGVEREYEGRTYFNPKDVEVTERSELAELSRTGAVLAFSGFAK